ncbi:MAG: endonuclease MutS2 [Campylobacterales bacterium]|nr:endonuclease MutS2 [Campylobacterales bacterium]
MSDLFSRLDLEGYLGEYQAFLAREKPIFLEGDSKLHFEMISQLQTYLYPAPPAVANLDTPLVHLTKQGILRLGEIAEFVKIIRYFRLLGRQPFEGRLGEWIASILVPPSVEEISEWFRDSGELNESIDPRFTQIKQAMSEVKNQLQSQFRQLLSTKRLEPYLVDHQVHLLHSQEALLVRGGFNHVLKGAVIGRSTSGFFYVVPESIEGLKKRESALLDDYESVVLEYCKKISAEFTKKQPFLKFVNGAFDRFDAYHARISFAKSRNLEFLLPGKGEAIKLSGFKHPAMHDPKPLHVNFQGSVLMVTGVNAGGKTMLLKSILSAVLMAKYLLPLPLSAAQSSIGSFKHIEAIIEDPQNVKNDISTFAGRMVHFSSLFGKKGTTLVGVDEIELGTDADEAASLFKVLIDQLMAQGAKLVITTHHKRLASLLATDERVELLAALYDEKNQRPTYDFLHGTIGKSYAFETALRYGIPASLIGKAKVLYGEDKENLNDLIQKNIDLELSMKRKLRTMEEEESRAKRLSERLIEKEEALELSYQAKEAGLEREYQKAIDAAKEAVRATESKEAHRALNHAHAAKKRVPTPPPLQAKEPLHVGDAIKYGRSKGVLKALNKEKAIIECEGITLHVPLHAIKRSGNPAPKPASKTKIDVQRTGRGGIKLDLHGMRGEEAVEKLDQFLSDALIHGFDEVLVYHGIGTGKLAYAVKTFLKSHPSVKSFTDAPPTLGGFGATVVTL